MDLSLSYDRMYSLEYIQPILCDVKRVDFYKINGMHVLSVYSSKPTIDREKLNYDRYLCDKFYYYWLKEKRERKFTQLGIDNLKNEIKHLKTKIA